MLCSKIHVHFYKNNSLQNIQKNLRKIFLFSVEFTRKKLYNKDSKNF